MTDEPEIYKLLNKIRYDATAIQAKITDALTTLSRMNLPDADAPTHVCPHCKTAFHSQRRRDEHLANVHGVPARANPTVTSSLGEG